MGRREKRFDTLHVGKVYNNTLFTVTAQVKRNRRVAQGPFDVYTYPGGRILGYRRDACKASDVQAPFFVHVYPVDEQELPAPRRQYGFDNLDFIFSLRGKQVAGRCWATVLLPTYAIARLRTGQYTERGEVWETELAGPLP